MSVAAARETGMQLATELGFEFVVNLESLMSDPALKSFDLDYAWRPREKIEHQHRRDGEISALLAQTELAKEASRGFVVGEYHGNVVYIHEVSVSAGEGSKERPAITLLAREIPDFSFEIRPSGILCRPLGYYFGRSVRTGNKMLDAMTTMRSDNPMRFKQRFSDTALQTHLLSLFREQRLTAFTRNPRYWLTQYGVQYRHPERRIDASVVTAVLARMLPLLK